MIKELYNLTNSISQSKKTIPITTKCTAKDSSLKMTHGARRTTTRPLLTSSRDRRRPCSSQGLRVPQRLLPTRPTLTRRHPQPLNFLAKQLPRIQTLGRIYTTQVWHGGMSAKSAPPGRNWGTLRSVRSVRAAERPGRHTCW